MTAIHVEVARGHNENTASVIRKFTRRVQSSSILSRVRKLRYFKRTKSDAANKKQALSRILRREKYTELLKLGKITEKPRGQKHGR